MPIFVLLLVAGALAVVSPYAAAESLLQQKYLQAREAQQQNDRQAYLALRRQLSNYPLAIYLDYHDLLARIDRIGPDDALTFISAAADSPLANRFKQRYLRGQGRRKHWGNYLQVATTQPRNIVLQCYYYRARHARGDQAQALQAAERLWLHGRSRPDECDPLFKHLDAAGRIDDSLIWQRMLMAFDAGQRSLMRYLSRQLSAKMQPWGARLIDIYQSPHHLSRSRHFDRDSMKVRNIVEHGLRRLARKNPEQAIKLWLDYQQQLDFGAEASNRITTAIARHSLIKKEQAAEPWLETQLPLLANDKLIEIRLRWLLEKQDWPEIARWIAQLSHPRQDSTTWQYWRARALEELGLTGEAVATYQQLANSRSFYGFLSAMRTNTQYQLQHQPLKVTPEMLPQVLSLPAVRRVEELMALEKIRDARSEWFHLLLRVETSQAEALANHALAQGWASLAINAAIEAQAWDAVDVRFPNEHDDIFKRFAKKRAVSPYDLMALARRESSFYPLAESHKGARGLMQLMPATAKKTARKIGFRYRGRSQLFKPEDNVRLGSAYYKQMLDRYDASRPLAFAAYNAGPNAVKRWLKRSDQSRRLDLWIETIPYYETRNYVQAVLSYGLIYQLQNGENPVFITKDEWQRLY